MPGRLFPTEKRNHSGSESRLRSIFEQGNRLVKKLIALVALMLMLGGATVSMAAADKDGEPANKHGMCTAYFNGQKNGHGRDEDDSSNYPGPFQDLEQQGRDYVDSDGADNDGDGDVDERDDEAGTTESDDLTVAENIFAYCDGTIGGNMDHGRFTCEIVKDDGGTPDDTTDDTQDTNCDNTDKPGNGGDK